MNLIFVITKNEIRTFRSSDGKTVSSFHISGEEIFEYDEYYDFAENLKDNLLAILNMRDFSEVAVDIAYIKGEKRAAEEILREFIPCLRVQAVEFDKINNIDETAEKMLCISNDKSAEFELTQKKLNEREKTISMQDSAINNLKTEKEKLEEAYNALVQEHESDVKKLKKMKSKIARYGDKYAKCRGVFKFPIEDYPVKSIIWTIVDEQTVEDDYYSDCKKIATIKFETDISNIKEKHLHFKLKNCKYELQFKHTSRNGEMELLKKLDKFNEDEYVREKSKFIILKSENLKYNEPFLMITHIKDTKEDALEWFENNLTDTTYQTYPDDRFACFLEADSYIRGEIDYNYSSGTIFESNEQNIKLGRCKGDRDYLNFRTNYTHNGVKLVCRGKESADIIITLNDGQKRKLLILDAGEIREEEIFAVLTHPDDPFESVKEWVEINHYRKPY